MANSHSNREKAGLKSRRDFLTGLGVAIAGASVLPASLAGFQQSRGGAKPIRLFNGKDLSGFTTWLHGLGKNNDPTKVFTVQDGILRISGETYGALISD